VEVHGSIDWSVCLSCGARYELPRVLDLIDAGRGIAPQCEACGVPLKPNVVLFGEMLPEQAMAEAQALAEEADLMLCIGSSLEVYPVAGLPEITKRRGGRLAIVTQGSTPYDGEADVRLSGDVVAELEGVLAAIDQGGDSAT
jgi:NAD-dependent deacetylase